MPEPIKIDVSVASQLANNMEQYSSNVTQYMSSTVYGYANCQSQWNDSKSALFVDSVNSIITKTNSSVLEMRSYAEKLRGLVQKLQE